MTNPVFDPERDLALRRIIRAPRSAVIAVPATRFSWAIVVRMSPQTVQSVRPALSSTST